MDTVGAVNFRVSGEVDWRVNASSPVGSVIREADAPGASPFKGRILEYLCIPEEDFGKEFSVIVQTRDDSQLRLFLTPATAQELFGPPHTSPEWGPWLRRNVAESGSQPRESERWESSE